MTFEEWWFQSSRKFDEQGAAQAAWNASRIEALEEALKTAITEYSKALGDGADTASAFEEVLDGLRSLKEGEGK